MFVSTGVDEADGVGEGVSVGEGLMLGFTEGRIVGELSTGVRVATGLAVALGPPMNPP